MARSGWSTSNYLSYAGGVVTAAPLTLGGWFKTSDTATFQFLMALHNNAGNNLNGVALALTTTTHIPTIRVADGVALSQANAASAISANTWFHVCGVYASATSYTCYKDGTAGTTTTTSRVPSGINRTHIGMNDNAGTPSFPLAPGGTGAIAWPAIWNIALSATDIAALAAGADPRLIHPEALVAFWPLNGEFSPEPNLLSNTTVMTMTGTLTSVAGPQSLFGAD